MNTVHGTLGHSEPATIMAIASEPGCGAFWQEFDRSGVRRESDRSDYKATKGKASNSVQTSDLVDANRRPYTHAISFRGACSSSDAIYRRNIHRFLFPSAAPVFQRTSSLLPYYPAFYTSFSGINILLRFFHIQKLHGQNAKLPLLKECCLCISYPVVKTLRRTDTSVLCCRCKTGCYTALRSGQMH